MMRFVLVITLLATLAFAKSVLYHSPQEVVKSYHEAINQGDIKTLKSVMVPDSFDVDMQSYALSVALADRSFHKVLKDYSENEKAKAIVIAVVEAKLKDRTPRTISDLKQIPLGKDRVMVRFLENGKKKQLYLSLEGTEWKINYLAGRKR